MMPEGAIPALTDAHLPPYLPPYHRATPLPLFPPQGQHSLSYQKYTPYEEDVRVPLFLRGPGVQAGVATDYQASVLCGICVINVWYAAGASGGYGAH